MTEKVLSRNEINFRIYLKRYHPDKYEQLMFLESTEKKEKKV